MDEVWKFVPNTNRRYKISNLGNLKTLNWKNTKKEKNMLLSKDNKGYLRTGIIINNKLKTVKIHRLVAQVFISNTYNKPQVNHIDFDKTNNCVNNLEWVTPKENYLHSYNCNRMKLPNPLNKNIKRGELNGFSILTEKDVIQIRNKFKPRIYTRKMLAKEYGVKESTIKDVISRKSWRHIK